MKILFILLILSTNALAMDRWTALAMLESGGNDRIVGQVGEISRYQIRPELWPGGNPLDCNCSVTKSRKVSSWSDWPDRLMANRAISSPTEQLCCLSNSQDRRTTQRSIIGMSW